MRVYTMCPAFMTILLVHDIINFVQKKGCLYWPHEYNR